MKKFILLNPGPACTTPTVRRALLTPDLCHREPEFYAVMQDCRRRLVKLAGGTDNDFSCILFTGSGTAAVESIICSAVPRGKKLLVIDNGVYGDRMCTMAEAHGIPFVHIKYEWTQRANPADVDHALFVDKNISHVAIVHHETTTGLLNPIREIGGVVAKHERQFIVDAMSSMFGEPFSVANDRVDFAAASSNKCIQGMPGLSFVVARRAVLEKLNGQKPRSVYLDLYNQWTNEEQDNTPFTPAVQVLFALKQAIAETEREGLRKRWKRYAACARTLRNGMERLGFKILVPPSSRSNLLTTFYLPQGVTYDALHDAMKKRGFVIYAGQSHIRKFAFRIANLGTLTPRDMENVVVAVASSMKELGTKNI
jgi:2-aminoethylphosphonate-pyruvate transaminase